MIRLYYIIIKYFWKRDFLWYGPVVMAHTCVPYFEFDFDQLIDLHIHYFRYSISFVE